MKIFNRDGKINFVDDNNLFVGFSLCEYGCCELSNAGLYSDENGEHIVLDAIPWGTHPEMVEFCGFNFNPNFYKQEAKKLEEQIDKEIGDSDRETCVAVFELQDSKQQKMYLILSNNHNGYYACGFNTTGFAENVKKEGAL